MHFVKWRPLWSVVVLCSVLFWCVHWLFLQKKTLGIFRSLVRLLPGWLAAWDLTRSLAHWARKSLSLWINEIKYELGSCGSFGSCGKLRQLVRLWLVRFVTPILSVSFCSGGGSVLAWKFNVFFASLCQIERTNERNQLERIQFSRLLLVRSLACKLFAFLPGQYIIVCMYVSSSLSSYELAKTKGLLSYSNEFSSPTNQSAPLFHSIQFFMLSFPFTATYLWKYCSCSHFRQVAAFIHSIIRSFEPTLPSRVIQSARLGQGRGKPPFCFYFCIFDAYFYNLHLSISLFCKLFRCARENYPLYKDQNRIRIRVIGNWLRNRPDCDIWLEANKFQLAPAHPYSNALKVPFRKLSLLAPV